MTISIARPHNADIARNELRRTVQPADVWDINSMRGARRYAAHVRTLDASDRKGALTHRGSLVVREDAFENMETRREKRGAIAMGVLLGIGLFVGSALGGAFSSGDVDPASIAPVDLVASVEAR